MRRNLPIFIALILSLMAALATVTAVAARPSSQLTITGVGPQTMLSTTGGTLSIYGTGFTTATVARLVGYGLLDTTFVNENALRAVVPPGVPAGVYALEVSEPGYSATLPSALTIVAPTPIWTTSTARRPSARL